MPTSITPPDLRNILADLGRRLGILERRITPRAPVTAGYAVPDDRVYATATNFPADLYPAGWQIELDATFDGEGVAFSTTDTGGYTNINILQPGDYAVAFAWGVVVTTVGGTRFDGQVRGIIHAQAYGAGGDLSLRPNTYVGGQTFSIPTGLDQGIYKTDSFVFRCPFGTDSLGFEVAGDHLGGAGTIAANFANVMIRRLSVIG